MNKLDIDIPPIEPEETNCEKCHGFIGVPGKIYGFAGKWCNCWMDKKHQAVDNKKWAERDAAHQERINRMKEDYERKAQERVKTCKYVHISGSGYCNKCGGVHELVKLDSSMDKGVEMVVKNLTRKLGEQ